MALGRRVTAETTEDLELAPAIEERRDEGLLDGDRAVEGALIAPCLELVGARDVPRRDLARLVVERRQMNRRRVGLGELLLEPEIGRRVVDRVAAEDEERADLTGPIASESCLRLATGSASSGSAGG